MDFTTLERRRKSPREVESRIRAGNVILNITSQFEGNSSLDELLFRISEQKIMKIVQEKQPLADLPCRPAK